MTTHSNLIASLVLQEFDKLPARRKPVVRDNGLREWVPLSGIVAEGKDGKLTCLSLATGMKCLPASKITQIQGNVLHDWHAEVLAIRAFNCFVLDECRILASNPESSSDFIRYRGNVDTARKHDGNGSFYDAVGWHGQPFTWKEDVLLHMYCTEAPCGDASMELTMASQADATPWAIPLSNHTPAPAASEPDTNTLLPGRAYFSQLGIVRRKPSRSDAPPTLSKSCSDKLALRQCTSLLSSPTSLLVSPENAYINTLILPESQYSASGCRRAFSDGRADDKGELGRGTETDGIQARMLPLAVTDQGTEDQRVSGGYAFRPFQVQTTDIEFAFSRRSAAATATTTTPSLTSSSSPSPNPNKITPSNLATAYTASGREETTLNGVLQGRKASSADVRGASFASRRRTWALAVEVANMLDPIRIEEDEKSNYDSNVDIHSIDNGNRNNRQIRRALGAIVLPHAQLPSSSPSSSSSASYQHPSSMEDAVEASVTYGDMKNTPLLEPRRQVKDLARRFALKGWIRNLGDEDLVL